MRTDAIDFCLRVSLAHGSLSLKLDDELGTYHGLSLTDLIALRLIAQAEGGRLPVAALARPLGRQPSSVMRELIRLEKTGHVQRERGAGGRHEVLLRPGGRRVLAEALVTAEQACAAALGELPAAALPAVAGAMDSLCRTPALLPE
jgi:DNA-binding MarR family transcriptional regulator